MVKIVEINKKKFAPASDQQKMEVKERIRKMQKEGDKLVKGMFEFVDAGGGWLDFSFRFFPDEPIRTVKIVHGEICDLPMIVVKHLNNVYKRIRTMPDNLDSDKPSIAKTSRCRFTPMDVIL